jgi:ABC-2 type transport system permease protein
MKNHAASKNYKMTSQKKNSVVKAIAFKELKRLTGSTTYMVNGALGMVLVVLLGAISLIVGFDRIVAIVIQGAPVDLAIIQPAIPLLIYFFTGMMATTACTPSLEGKNYWIVQSLPIEKKTLYHGKMLFNMCLAVPATIFGILTVCISTKVPILNILVYLLLGITLCAFSTAWGCVCGVRYMRLDWENEVEVIKQGTAVTAYLLPNMIAVMILMVVVVFLGTKVDHKLIALILTLIAGVLAILSYMKVLKLAKEDMPVKVNKKAKKE